MGSTVRQSDQEEKAFIMKSIFLISIALLVVMDLQFSSAQPPPQIGIGARQKRSDTCTCLTFTSVAQNGQIIGDCQSIDNTGRYWCYMNKNCLNCEANSGTFPTFCKSYAECRRGGNVVRPTQG